MLCVPQVVVDKKNNARSFALIDKFRCFQNVSLTLSVIVLFWHKDQTCVNPLFYTNIFLAYVSHLMKIS